MTFRPLKPVFAKTECIITGAEGEYDRELDKDELTAESTTLEDELLASVENKTKLYTAISSKGLEFKAVLLYRFADQLPKSFTKILNRETLLSESDKYDLSHFFTKLYIAISRAKEVLYIADTHENYEKFWRHFIDNSFVKGLMCGKQDQSTWGNKVGGIEIGQRGEYLSRMAENFSPLDTARKIYEDARLSKNSKDMNRAVGYFEEAGDSMMAEECKAYVLLFENKFKESGAKFLKLEKREEARIAFWKGCCWEELCQHSDREIFRMTALFMEGQLSLIDFIVKDNIAENFSFLDDTWKQVAIQIGNQSKSIQPDLVFSVCEFLEKLSFRGFANLNPTIADLYFKNKQYKNAVDKWNELSGKFNDNRYV